eukprot:1179921-Prorocentrum_minimum.AAC.1
MLAAVSTRRAWRIIIPINEYINDRIGISPAGVRASLASSIAHRTRWSKELGLQHQGELKWDGGDVMCLSAGEGYKTPGKPPVAPSPVASRVGGNPPL